jgi:hypothetical protein
MASALAPAAASVNNPACTTGPEPPSNTQRSAAKHAVASRPGWSRYRMRDAMRKAAALTHDATTLTIATSHATTPNRGTEPARVKRSSIQGETIATAKLYSSRHTATLILPPFPAAPRILSPVWLRRSAAGAANW